MKWVVILLMLSALATGVSAVLLKHWSVYDDAPFYELVENNVDLDVSKMRADEIKVVFAIPELGVRESRGPYDPHEFRHASIHKTLLLPWNADYGEYAIRMTISDSKGNKKVRHRIIEIK
ncbi:MAG: hypothetical protein QXR48_03720 [Candidatus Woesearchaeota archaeon]